MIKKIFNFLFKSGKKATESVGKSMEFIDDVLEKEYITNTVVNVKDASGKVVEKAGEAFQNTKEFIDDKVDVDKVISTVGDASEKVKDKAEEAFQSTKEFIDDKVDLDKIKTSVGAAFEKGKEATSDIADQMLDKSDTLKNVMNEGKEIIDKIIGKGEEE